MLISCEDSEDIEQVKPLYSEEVKKVIMYSCDKNKRFVIQSNDVYQYSLIIYIPKQYLK